MLWTRDRVDLLKVLWAEGLSASLIAGRLGGVTRNAVIGKVHGLGLSGRATTLRMEVHRPPPQAPKTKELHMTQWGNPREHPVSQKTEPVSPPIEELVIPLAERKTLEMLSESSCRWPIGDPHTEDFHFCGKLKVKNIPYCEFHARRAFQLTPPRKRELVGVE